jgi:hypothetical protein
LKFQKLVHEKLKQSDIGHSEKLSALKTSLEAVKKEIANNSKLMSSGIFYYLPETEIIQQSYCCSILKSFSNNIFKVPFIISL